MRSTATSPATSRCAWRRRRARTRASSPPPSSRRCRRARSWRAPRSPAPASSISTWPRRPTRASCAPSTRAVSATARARSAPASACWSSSSRPIPTGPLHVGHGRQAAYGATLANLLRRGRLPRRSASTTSTMPAGRWTSSRSAPGCATCEALRRDAAVSRRTAIAATTCAPSAQQLQAAAARRCGAPPPQVLAGLPADAPGGRQGGIHRRADRALPRAARRGAASEHVLDLSLAAMLADIRDDLAEFGVQFDHWYSERALSPTAARSIARSRVLRGAGPTVATRTARCGSAPASSATRRTAWWCARTARRPTSPPTSPTTWTSASAASSA